MSEFTENHKHRLQILTNYSRGLINGESGTELLKKYKILETTFFPKDMLPLFDNLFNEEFPIEDIKTASSKLFNILYKNLSGLPKPDYPHNSILNILLSDNKNVLKRLDEIKPLIRQINKTVSTQIREALIKKFSSLRNFTEHYVVLQNIIFPEIEKKWEHHQCLKIMWSFQDDVKQNISKTIDILEDEKFDLKLFNRISSKVFFNINTLIFREQNILFPIIHETLNAEIFETMRQQLSNFKLAFSEITPIDVSTVIKSNNSTDVSNKIKLSTGELNIEQLELIFKHLPVDITYVDENDEVKYFSSPKERVFPRSISIIGRKVQNCHPHESVHVVEQIVDAFKTGEKDDASFWIKMGPKFVLIQYFAVRDDNKNYKGVLEVSQEISKIQEIKGEKRLLNWEIK